MSLNKALHPQFDSTAGLPFYIAPVNTRSVSPSSLSCNLTEELLTFLPQYNGPIDNYFKLSSVNWTVKTIHFPPGSAPFARFDSFSIVTYNHNVTYFVIIGYTTTCGGSLGKNDPFSLNLESFQWRIISSQGPLPDYSASANPDSNGNYTFYVNQNQVQV